ncbi:MAG: helix-turn-helix domain-containing protein [Clostridia bacterium]|nr:helix-turn-helix domain-containing protein [Clostridia bacterium]
MYTKTAYPVINLAETGRRIERQRREAGLTVRDLQTYFGFEYPQAIYKWQHGECLPTVDNLLALARLLRVPMEDLLVYEDQGVSHFWRIPSNHRFNDKRTLWCYA